MTNSSLQQGLSIVELMVALFLSAVLTTALYQVFVSNQQNAIVADTYTRIQDSSRTAFNLMEYDMRMAGHRGCIINYKENLHSHLDTTDTNYHPEYLDFNLNDPAPIASPNFTQSPDYIEFDESSDAILLRKAIPLELMLERRISANEESLELIDPKGQLESMQSGDVLMLTDCKHADVFSVSSVEALTGRGKVFYRKEVSGGVNNVANASNNVELAYRQEYKEGSQLLLMHSVLYFIAPSQLLEGQGVNSLYVYDTQNSLNNSRELVPYVEQMQIEYLVENDDEERVYKRALDAEDNVFAIRIMLQMATDRSCGMDNANAQNCVAPQNYERVFFLRNSRDWGA